MRRLIVEITTEATEKEEAIAAQSMMMSIVNFAAEAGCSIEKIENLKVSSGLMLPPTQKKTPDLKEAFRRQEVAANV